MRTLFVTSSRSDFGLIRPVLKRFVQRAPGRTALACLGPAALEPAAALRAGIGDFPLLRFPDGSAGRVRSTHGTVRSFSRLCLSFSARLSALRPRPDWVLLPGDRFEVYAAQVACHYNNQPTAHLFAGDRSVGGHLDDNARHAISRLAHILLAASADSARRLVRMGEEPWRVHDVGSPVVESVKEAVRGAPPLSALMAPGRRNVLCTYHPIGTEPRSAGRQFAALVAALRLVRRRADAAFLLTYPNNEFGSEPIVRILSRLRGTPGFTVVESLGWKNYLAAMSRCDLVVGNSSSGLLEAPIVGTPSLDVGTRQRGRLAPAGVRRIESYDPRRIADAVLAALAAPRRPRAHPYGDGRTSQRVWDILARSKRAGRGRILRKEISY